MLSIGDAVARGIRRPVLLAAIAVATAIAPAHALTQDEADAIATDAYVYFYPLVTMDLTRLQSTNVEKPEGTKGPANTFVNVPSYPPADFKTVVRPNFDTLYSSAMLDLTEEPVVISVPSTDGRYYLLPMLDMWTDIFASPGWRTTGTGAQTLLVTPPGWQASDDVDEIARLPDDTQHIAAHDALCLDHRPHQDRRAVRLSRGQQDPGRPEARSPVPLW